MNEHEIGRKCQDAFPGMESKTGLNYSAADLEESTLNSRNNLLKQTELAKDLGFPAGESLIDRAAVAKSCVEHFKLQNEIKDLEGVINQFRRDLANSVLLGNDHAAVLKIGAGELKFHGRLPQFEPPKLNENQSQILKSVSASPDLSAEIKQIDPKRPDFWLVVRKK